MADPNALYSYQGQEPQPLPHEINYTEAWGGTNFRQGVESFTDEELVKAGYTGPYEVPSIDTEYQRLEWDNKKLKYVVKDIPEEELWEKIREKRNNLLAECDWTMGVDVPKEINKREWELHRQRLRDITTLYTNPRDVVWPLSPEGRSDDTFDQPRIYEDSLRFKVKNLEGKIELLENLINDLVSKIET